MGLAGCHRILLWCGTEHGLGIGGSVIPTLVPMLTSSPTPTRMGRETAAMIRSATSTAKASVAKAAGIAARSPRRRTSSPPPDPDARTQQLPATDCGTCGDGRIQPLRGPSSSAYLVSTLKSSLWATEDPVICGNRGVVVTGNFS